MEFPKEFLPLLNTENKTTWQVRRRGITFRIDFSTAFATQQKITGTKYKSFFFFFFFDALESLKDLEFIPYQTFPADTLDIIFWNDFNSLPESLMMSITAIKEKYLSGGIERGNQITKCHKTICII